MWLMGVVSRRRVWLECIGVVSGCCKEVYRYPHNNYNFSLLYLYYIALFWQQHHYFFVHFKNVFSFLFTLFLCNKNIFT